MKNTDGAREGWRKKGRKEDVEGSYAMLE